jgi:hypothetical protein
VELYSYGSVFLNSDAVPQFYGCDDELADLKLVLLEDI